MRSMTGSRGCSFPHGIRRALRAALERLLEDPALRDRLGRAGREKVEQELSWDAATRATISAYRDAQ